MQRPNLHLESVAPFRSRVVLAARDRRFLRVTSFLLARQGFLVDSTRKLEDLLGLVKRHRPDVVILDGMDSLQLTARALAEIDALPYSVSVLVVAEVPEASSPTSVRLLHKWTSFDRLVQEVERLSEDTRRNGESSNGSA
jgi:DNA-binding NtrC family response regulator